eukprot:4958970-Amphidinium_carterae.1
MHAESKAVLGQMLDAAIESFMDLGEIVTRVSIEVLVWLYNRSKTQTQIKPLSLLLAVIARER